MPSRWLYVKSRIVGTPIGVFASAMRSALDVRRRWKYPELWEIHLSERQLEPVLRKLLRHDSNAIDIGCHIGSFLCEIVRLAPDGRHVAFEASPTKAGWLRARYALSVEIVDKAVSDVHGLAVFEEDDRRPGYSRLSGAAGISNGGVRSYEVGTCRIDDVLAGKHRVDLIKLDIEGAELSALKGAEQVIKRHKPALIFECGSEYALEGSPGYRRELYDFITQRLGYDILTFSDFLFVKGPLGFDEFRRCGLYPFRAFNFVGMPR